jgi:hypothetical protein
VAGNSGMHTVKFVAASTGADVAGGSVQVNMTGCSGGQFVYSSLATAITLAANTNYYLVSLEVSGGDYWLDYSPGGITTTNVASVTKAIYFSGGWIAVAGPNTSYVPANFQYTTN